MIGDIDPVQAVLSVGGLALTLLYLWGLTKFERKRTRAERIADEESLRKKIEDIGDARYTVRTQYHEQISNLTAGNLRLQNEQVRQSVLLERLQQDMHGVHQAVDQMNQHLADIRVGVGKISGIWEEHTRTYGGVALTKEARGA